MSVVGFGFDSAIESMAAILVALRLSARLRHGVADERKERIALKLIAVSFLILAGYVTIEGIHSLVTAKTPESSLVALILFVIVLAEVVSVVRSQAGRAEGR